MAQPRRVIWPWMLLTVAGLTAVGSATPLAWVLTHRPALQLQAETQDFGLVSLGQSGTLPVTVRNSGGTEFALSATIQGDTRDFDFAQDTCAGFSLPAGGVCSLTIRFRPASAGTRTATLSVVAVGSGVRQSLSLCGTAQGVGKWSFTPTFVYLGLFSASSTVPVTLTNTGSTAITIRSVQIVPQPAEGDFQVASGGCTAGATLEPGGSCQMLIQFRPLRPVTFGKLVVESDLAPMAVLPLIHDLSTSG